MTAILNIVQSNGQSSWNIDDLNKIQVPNKYQYILDILKQSEINYSFTKDMGVVKGIIINNNVTELIGRSQWIEFNKWINFNKSIKKKYHQLLIDDNYYHQYLQENIIISKNEKLELKENKITYLQENMNMQLEDKDYLLENKLLKTQINDQEEIIRRLLERLEVLNKKNKEKNKNTLSNTLSNTILNIFT